MDKGVLFWVLMILWALSWFVVPVLLPGAYGPYVNSALVFVLLALLGWKVFGAAVK